MKTKKYYNPKVSILVANYNNEKFLKRAINSLLNQCYKNVEIIVHDDRSTDMSLSILET
jgi:glycosyltransferase involved in cell wall biosynthesis